MHFMRCSLSSSIAAAAAAITVASKHSINKIAQISILICWPPNPMLSFQKEENNKLYCLFVRSTQKHREGGKIFSRRCHENTTESAT